MKPTSILMLLGPLWALQACAASTPSAEGLDVPPPEAAITAPCASPVRIPEGDLMQAEAERLWLRDRANLAACRDRQALLADWVAGVLGAVTD
jgi:hypothetical protein